MGVEEDGREGRVGAGPGEEEEGFGGGEEKGLGDERDGEGLGGEEGDSRGIVWGRVRGVDAEVLLEEMELSLLEVSNGG